MKIRTDFVTNSSSSSFILARNSEMNEKQKEEIIKYVEKKFLGEPILTPESSEEEINKVFEDNSEFNNEKVQKLTQKALSEGKTIYCDEVDFELWVYSASDMFGDIWRIMKENSEETFIEIDGGLSY